MMQDRGEKCIVKGCKNHPEAGKFVGVLCFPCWEMVTTGNISRGQTAFHDLQPAMNEELARVILGATIMEDNRLENSGDYVVWPSQTSRGTAQVCLDSEFSADQLRAIAWWMTNMRVQK